MQAVIVFNISLEDLNARERADIIYRSRNIVLSRLGSRVFDTPRESILAITSNVRDALSLARRTLGDLRGIPTTVSIGYGDLYKTVDGNYWGREIDNALDLARSSVLRDTILLTDSAKSQLPNVNISSCPF